MSQPRPSREVWAELRSPTALASAMDYHGESVRSLAAACGLHPSAIGHLRTGHRTTCYPSTAKAIEKALHLPPGLLFILKVNAVRKAA